MTQQVVHVWGCASARTLRVYWALHELDLPFVSHPVRTRTADMDEPAFLKISPGRKIPALEHGLLRLTESGAITDYLFKLAGAASSDVMIAARIEQWSCFTLMEIDATALYVLRRHRDLPEIYGEAPAACQAAEDYYLRQINVVADELGDGREFIAGNSISKADIFLVTCCEWALIYKLEVPAVLLAYRERLVARDAYQAAYAVNFAAQVSAH